MKRAIEPHFGPALRRARQALGVAQDEFDVVSGRTYVSALEREIKQPTLVKVAELASVLDLHPLTLLTLAFCRTGSPAEVAALVSRVVAESDRLAGASRS